MSNKLKLEESLSALMDNEVDDLELRRILKALKETPDGSHLQQKWERYHLLSSVLQQEAHSQPKVDLLSGIRAKLDEEPALSASASQANSFEFGKTPNNSFFKRLGQGAIAASAALGVLFSANFILAPATLTLGPTLADTEISVEAIDSDALPAFNGDFTASDLTRVVSYDSDSEDEALRNRLSRAVYRALDESTRSLQTAPNESQAAD